MCLIKAQHFPKTKKLDLPDGVYGDGNFDRIRDASELRLAKHNRKKHIPTLFESRRCTLSFESHDRCENNVHHSYKIPFHGELVKAESRNYYKYGTLHNQNHKASR